MKTRSVKEITTVWTTEVIMMRSVLSTKGGASGSYARPLIKTRVRASAQRGVQEGSQIARNLLKIGERFKGLARRRLRDEALMDVDYLAFAVLMGVFGIVGITATANVSPNIFASPTCNCIPSPSARLQVLSVILARLQLGPCTRRADEKAGWAPRACLQVQGDDALGRRSMPVPR